IADEHKGCPYTKNLVANEIKNIIRSYDGGNQLEYVVLAGSDNVIPFFRYPDQAGLANENEYSPPVLDSGAAQSALRYGQILSQDNYGSRVELVRSDRNLPLPQIAVGRLVETIPEMSHMLDLYTATRGVITPKSALVTGYDFVAD